MRGSVGTAVTKVTAESSSPKFHGGFSPTGFVYSERCLFSRLPTKSRDNVNATYKNKDGREICSRTSLAFFGLVSISHSALLSRATFRKVVLASSNNTSRNPAHHFAPHRFRALPRFLRKPFVASGYRFTSQRRIALGCSLFFLPLPCPPLRFTDRLHPDFRTRFSSSLSAVCFALCTSRTGYTYPASGVASLEESPRPLLQGGGSFAKVMKLLIAHVELFFRPGRFGTSHAGVALSPTARRISGLLFFSFVPYGCFGRFVCVYRRFYPHPPGQCRLGAPRSDSDSSTGGSPRSRDGRGTMQR